MSLNESMQRLLGLIPQIKQQLKIVCPEENYWNVVIPDNLCKPKMQEEVKH
jgi:hypothetical protein